MKKLLCFVAVFVLSLSLLCIVANADSVTFSYKEVASNDFETNNVFKTHYANAGSGGVTETSTTYAHSGKYSLRRTGTTQNQGVKVYDVFDNVLKTENVGKKYRVSAWVYTPDTTTGTSYGFTISTVEEGGYTFRNYGVKYGVKPNVWTKVSMIMTLSESDITNFTNSVRICQQHSATEDTCAKEFYVDDILLEEMTENKTVTASGFETYFSTDAESGDFVTGFKAYSDNYHTGYGYKLGGAAKKVAISPMYNYSGKNSIVLSERTSDVHRVKLSNLLPAFDSSYVGKVIRISGYFGYDNPLNSADGKTSDLYLTVMTDASTTAILAKQQTMNEYEANYVELEFIVTDTFLSTLNGYPARVAIETRGEATPQLVWADDLKVEIATTSIASNSYFSDNAVLQRDMPINIYGVGTKDGEKVEVTLDGVKKETTVKDGSWIVTFEPMSAKKDVKLIIKNGTYEKHINNIAIGELWFTSGQSNMQFRMYDLKEEDLKPFLDNCEKYDVRFIDQTQPAKSDLEKPHIDVNGARWYLSTRDGVRNMSCLGYLMAYQLSDDLDVTVGLVDVALGGSKIETWLSREVLESRSEYASKVEELDEKIASDDYINSKIPAADYKLIPNALYNSFYSPFKNIKARGMIWYQGESNSSNASSPYYDLMLEDLINMYRKDQNNNEFHVIPIMLAPYVSANSDFPLIRQYTFDVSKRMTNVYPISTSNEGPDDYDFGISNSIHPSNKIPVGNRIYLAAKANIYKELNYQGSWNGPLYDSMKVSGNKAVLSFKQVGEGLRTIDGSALKGFKISQDGSAFVDATATIVGDTIEVYADSVSTPKEVRYCYVNSDDTKKSLGGNLTNETMIPAIPFRATVSSYEGAKEVDGKKAEYTLTNKGFSSDKINVIFALYDYNGVMKTAKVVPVDVSTIGNFNAEYVFENMESTDTIQVFAFKNGIVPVTKLK
ncbi:MAG: hypothetical protein E7391_02135 [Ruminococcaceae bacterium]|nr:hypothetical protein [Oscillospiraceae bacterium]